MERTAGRDVPSRWREHLGLSTLSLVLTPPQLQTVTHELLRGCGAAATAAFVEGQVEDGVFQAPSLGAAAHFGARRKRRKRKFAVQSWS